MITCVARKNYLEYGAVFDQFGVDSDTAKITSKKNGLIMYHLERVTHFKERKVRM